MEREMEEIIQSQQIMLGKSLEIKNKVYPTVLAETFTKQLEKTRSWIQNHPQFDVLYVDYKDVISNPSDVAEKLSMFLDADLNIDAMIKNVDPLLYRNKKNNSA